MTVAAVVLASADAARTRRTLDAVAAQTLPLAHVRLVATGTLGALAVDAQWTWILDGTAVPLPDALERLLEAAELPDLPRPALLASKVVGPDGDLDREAAPWPRLTEKAVAVTACEHRLVSIRAARHGSLLVHAEAVAEHGLPRAEYANAGEDLEWTARVLRTAIGMLVPRSVAVRHAPSRSACPALDVRNRAAMLRGDAWELEEKLWFGYALMADVARRRAPRVAAAAVRGLLLGPAAGAHAQPLARIVHQRVWRDGLPLRGR